VDGGKVGGTWLNTADLPTDSAHVGHWHDCCSAADFMALQTTHFTGNSMRESTVALMVLIIAECLSACDASSDRRSYVQAGGTAPALGGSAGQSGGTSEETGGNSTGVAGQSSCEAGTLGCACYGNQTCNAGLSCTSNLCAQPGGSGGSGNGASTPQGGSPESGGSAPIGGTASGGASGTSLAGSTGVGGSPGTGGSSLGSGQTTGGAPSTGGSVAAGGTPIVGGEPGTGGTVAAGGTSGIGGSGGGCQSTCSNPLVIDDIEDGDLVGCPRSGWTSGWWMATDGEGLSEPADKTGLVVATTPARTGSCYALHMKGSGFTSWGAVLGFTMNNPDETVARAVDLSGYTGIAFWLRGSGTMTLQIATVSRQVEDSGGTCVGEWPTCQDFFQTTAIPLPSSWSQYQFHFDTLAPYKSSSTKMTAADLKQALTLQFSLPKNTTFDLWLDDVAFF
jgi:hypothetical protein